jgi:superfamily II RNA helicase
MHGPKKFLQEFEQLILQAQDDDLTLEQIESMFPYPLDSFQREAIEKSINGSSVVVCAPTGAGKTVIAVAAAVPVLAAGKRVIYTTPLKALSNQKLTELQVRSLRCLLQHALQVHSCSGRVIVCGCSMENG